MVRLFAWQICGLLGLCFSSLCKDRGRNRSERGQYHQNSSHQSVPTAGVDGKFGRCTTAFTRPFTVSVLPFGFKLAVVNPEVSLRTRPGFLNSATSILSSSSSPSANGMALCGLVVLFLVEAQRSCRVIDESILFGSVPDRKSVV